jgi:hypothetical protein
LARNRHIALQRFERIAIGMPIFCPPQNKRNQFFRPSIQLEPVKVPEQPRDSSRRKLAAASLFAGELDPRQNTMRKNSVFLPQRANGAFVPEKFALA